MEKPSVTELLAVDREYREKAAKGELRMITPANNNPEKKRWLPILNTIRDGIYFTAVFSNTTRAHELGKTNDWVVIYYAPSASIAAEEQCTVVTDMGKRVIRGRELECLQTQGGK